MNIIFFVMVAAAFLVAAYRHVTWVVPTVAAGEELPKSPMEHLGLSMIDTAEVAVTLAIGLIGVMGLFLGLMKIAEEGGLLRIIAKLLRPMLIRLFPDVPTEHPAMGAIVMNVSANALGLGNAATPFGIRAMQELDKLNPHKGTATNAMALFLAINTSSVTLLPTGVIAIRAASGSADPAGIVPTTLIATICSTVVAIISAKFLQRHFKTPPPDADFRAEGETAVAEDDMPQEGTEAYPLWASVLALGALFSLVPLTVAYGSAIAPWIIPGLMIAFLSFGVAKRVPIYEAFVEGARDGFNVAVRIIPYLVAILVAVGMFRASGAMDLVISPIGTITGAIGLPADALPMALMRPLSGSGAYGIMASIISDPSIGPDSYVGYLVSTIQGSTETTFYVLAVYFGAVQIRRVRHALCAALLADLAGIAGAVAACLYLFGHLT
ncbi:MAG: nucleoside recognition domain-containing protein [Alphaproteobacteria bacterium]